MKEGIILFAHGSRDPEWARPFEAIRGEVAKSGAEVRLAYLEIMQPTLAQAIAELANRGVASIRVVPLFLGFGGHVKDDLPRLVAAAQAKVKISVEPPIGERANVTQAIAAAIARPLKKTR